MPTPMRSRRIGPSTAALLGLALLAGCSVGEADEVPVPSADPCLAQDVTEVPEVCADEPSTAPGASPPASSAEIAAVTLPPAKNELARIGNDDDPALTEASFSVTIPAGARLRSTVVCNGAGTVRLTTVPSSGAQQEFRCEYGGEGVELTVEAATQVSQEQAYTARFTAEAPARWLVVLSYVEGPPNADVIDG